MTYQVLDTKTGKIIKDSLTLGDACYYCQLGISRGQRHIFRLSPVAK